MRLLSPRTDFSQCHDSLREIRVGRAQKDEVMDTRWHKLLSHWIDVELRHSLSFPFLLGALREPVGFYSEHEDTSRGEPSQLLKAIWAFEADEYIFHVYRCHNLDKLVLTRVCGSPPPPPGRPWFSLAAVRTKYCSHLMFLSREQAWSWKLWEMKYG